VHTIVGCVNRTTGATIDVVEPEQQTPMDILEQREHAILIRKSVYRAMQDLKKHSLAEYALVRQQFNFSIHPRYDHNLTKLSRSPYRHVMVMNGINFLKTRLSKNLLA
jgi:hypothetical protein